MVLIKNRIIKPISEGNFDKTKKTVCKITSIVENSPISGTGFFMTITNSLRYLVTCYHNVKYAIEKKSKIILEIFDNIRYELELNNRSIQIVEYPEDIAAIEIKDSDSIYKYIEFLEYDKEYITHGYSIYKDKELFSVQYLYEGLSFSTGFIKNINNFEFFHDMSTGRGSSGCPILLYSNRIIGIHNGYMQKQKLNVGYFIGEFIKKFDLPNQLNIDKNSQSMDKNKIFTNINNSKINNKIYNPKINANINKNINNTKNNNINSIKDFSNNYINTINNKVELTLDLTKSQKISNNIKEDSKEIITFYIKSIDQLLNCKVSCKSSNIFNTVMNVIFEKEPSFIEKVGYFLCNGNKINEYKTIKQNEIKNNDTVLMNNLD